MLARCLEHNFQPTWNQPGEATCKYKLLSFSRFRRPFPLPPPSLQYLQPAMPTFTIFKGSNEGIIIESETTRSELSSDEVLVSITASGLCGDDHLFKGIDVRIEITSKITFIYSPESAKQNHQVKLLTSKMVLGHEGVGIVLEICPGVRRLKKVISWDGGSSRTYVVTVNNASMVPRRFVRSAEFTVEQILTREAWHMALSRMKHDFSVSPLSCQTRMLPL